MMKPSGKKMVDDYIQSEPKAARILLKAVRDHVKKILPEVEERMAWNMPTFDWNGILLTYAGFKSHVSLFPGTDGVESLGEKWKPYISSKGTVQLPLDEPLPEKLLSLLIQFARKRNLKKVSPLQSSRKKFSRKKVSEKKQPRAQAIRKKSKKNRVPKR
ncbi:MAG: hypothetical protein EOP09_07600 [Proteobacteria bacterium]|nr:MAG: hypothetical protein EOP09_07600 [Pseudomonadota bacterium]